MKRVGIVGSRTYTNRRKIKEFVFKLKEQFGDKVEVVSGGQKLGADGFAKKFSLEFDMKYVEFPPRHYTYNQHCILDESHYGKRYFPKKSAAFLIGTKLHFVLITIWIVERVTHVRWWLLAMLFLCYFCNRCTETKKAGETMSRGVVKSINVCARQPQQTPSLYVV